MLEHRESGITLGRRYRLVEVLGAGASGETWRALDLVDEREVALKLAPAHASAAQVASLRQEFELLRGVHHPHVAQVLEFGAAPDGVVFHTRILVEGEPLSGSSPAAREALLDAIEGLAFLHELGIAHGDFKPENVLVSEAGTGVLIDLGGGHRGPTSPGAPISGTEGFVAPELLSGAGGDRASDVYAVGRTLEEISPRALRGRAADALAREPTARPSATELLEVLGRPRPLGMRSARSVALVGREAELGAWETRLARLARGEPTAVTRIVGPSGIGKTRTLRELAWRAQARFDVIVARPGTVRRALEAALEVEGLEPILARLAGRDRPWVVLVDDVHDLDPLERQLLVALEEAPRCLLAVSSLGGEASLDGEASLPPLDATALARWAPSLSTGAIARLHDATGGHPADVESVLVELAAGRADEVDLGAAPAELVLSLSGPAQDALATLLVGDPSPSDPRGWLELQRAGWVRYEGGRLALARPARGKELATALAQRVRGVHRAALSRPDLDPARRAAHLAGAGERAQAVEQIGRAEEDWARRPRAWRVALEAVQPEGSLGARAWSTVGRPARALGALAAMGWRDPDSMAGLETRRELGAAYLQLGDLTRAKRHLRRADPDDPRVADALARVLVRTGEPAEARALALRALEVEPKSPHVAASLHEIAGLAALYLGEIDSARAALERATVTGSPRERVRRSSYLAIACSRVGDVEGAHPWYVEALREAERAELTDMLASTILNVATSAQRMGRWGESLAAYHRAAALAGALGKRTTVATIRFNVANLRLAIGDVAYVRAQLEPIRSEILGAGLDSLSISLAILEGELAALEGAPQRATEAYDRALDLARRQGSVREALEAELGLAALRPAEPAALEELRARCVTQGAADLEARVLGSLGAAAASAGHEAEALERFEQALVRAASERALEAELLEAAGRVAERIGATALASGYRERARASWERIALTLQPEDRACFWRHPRRHRAPSASEGAAPALERILAINRDLNASLTAPEVLSRAIDAAIELTGAERGFVLLQDGDTLDVAVARNLDRERVGRSHLKFSRSIAEDVVRSGRVVLTSDAGADERFRRNRSVLAMRLRSVACVPILGTEGALGAIYVDNRFERGRFDESAGRLLAAFADQVAVALTNARLHSDLIERTEQLERERARVSGLLEEREREIERLSAARPPSQNGLRFDFRPLVAQSAAMRALLATLERVIETPLSVLIQGESGTGKELVARAIHGLGPRRDAPFVSINCGAVPAALLESELFGHVRGAFTGAERAREGLLSKARGGTVFLDEIGEMPTAMQVKLLRVLQEREVRPVGGSDVIALDVRWLAATNRDLREEVDRGGFREDLYYRLAVVDVTLPPLRERLDDLPSIAAALLARKAEELGRPTPSLRPDALRVLLRHPWPGNVRELDNVLSRGLVMASDPESLDAPDLDLARSRALPRARSRDEHEARERDRILAELESTGWNVSEVSRRLAIPRNTLYRRMKRFGVRRG